MQNLLARVPLRLRGLSERMRESLFWIPSLYVLGGFVLARALGSVDGREAAVLDDVPLLLDTTVQSARAILGAIAGATITVAGVVFSITAVAVQLASTQFSPRVLRGFMRDRFQQNAMGFLVGTFTYSVLVLAEIYDAGGTSTVHPSLSVTVAVALTVVAVLVIVASIDHTMRSMQAGEVLRRVAAETHARISELFPDRAGERERDDIASPPRPGEDKHVVRAKHSGWVQQFDVEGVLRALPEDTVGRLETRSGEFLERGARIVTVWPPPPEPERFAGAVRACMQVGPERRMQEDVAFGFRQIADVCLRALSPGINDPTTCVEGLRHLGDLVAHVLSRDLPDRTLTAEGSRRLFRAQDLSPRDYVGLAFDEIRNTGTEFVAVDTALLQALGGARERLTSLGLEHRTDVLEHHAELLLDVVRETDLHSHDLAHIRDVAVGAGFEAALDDQVRERRREERAAKDSA